MLVLAGLGLLVGMCIAPALITGYTLVESLVPAGARTEAFTWLTGAVALGQAAAVTIAGQLEDRFWGGAGFLVPMGELCSPWRLCWHCVHTSWRGPAAGPWHVASVTECRWQWTDPREYVTMDHR